MQLAVHADSPVYDLSPSHSPSTRRSTKFMVAGVAMASAGVIAVSPVAPPMPNIQEVQERVTQAAVQLTAAANPLVVWQQTVANTFASLETLVEGSSLATENLVEALSTGYIFQEVANILIQNTLNPGPLLDQIVNFNSNFGPVINTAITQTIERLTLAAEQFPEVITNTLTYLSQGQFVESFSEINGWFVLRVLGGIRPLIPIFDIPGNFVAALPGAEKLPVLLKVINEFGITKAIFEPILGGILQTAELLDAARASFAAGDYLDGVANLVNIPPLAFNALFNGFTPNGVASEWQGLLDRGLISYLTVTFPNQIANAIKPPVTVNNLAFSAKQDVLAPQAPTEYSFGGKTYSFENGSIGVVDNSGAGDGTGAGDGSGTGDGSGELGAGDGDLGAGDGDGDLGAGDGDGDLGDGDGDLGAGDGDGDGDLGAGDGDGDGDLGAGDGDGDLGAGDGDGDDAGDGDTGTGTGTGGTGTGGTGTGGTGTGTGGTTGTGTGTGGTTGGGTTGGGTTGGGTTGGGDNGGGDS